jgi:hypothetical protein
MKSYVTIIRFNLVWATRINQQVTLNKPVLTLYSSISLACLQSIMTLTIASLFPLTAHIVNLFTLGSEIQNSCIRY